MPFYSLVNKGNNQVVQVVDAPYKKFDCHENFMWKDGPTEYDPSQGLDYEYDTGTNSIKIVNYGEKPWQPERVAGYGDPYSQLALLFDDIHHGRLPGKETSEWYKHVLSVKQRIPKSNI